jgi:hypothetical protein
LGRQIIGVLVLSVAVLVVGLTLRKVVRPFMFYFTESSSVRELQRENKSLQAENRRLLRQRKYLLSKEGSEVEARKLGWALPGERTLVLEKGAAQPAPKATAKQD